IWPAILVAGIFFAVPQFLVSNFHGPWLVDVTAAVVSIGALAVFLKFWHPKNVWSEARPTGRATETTSDVTATAPLANEALPHDEAPDTDPARQGRTHPLRPWLPWIILSIVVFVWGLPQVKTSLDRLAAPKIPVHYLDKMVLRVPPAVAQPAAESAVFNFNF